MDFQHSARERRPIDQRETRRLVWLFFALGLVLIAVSVVAGPSGTAWLGRLFGDAGAAGPQDRGIDNRISTVTQGQTDETLHLSTSPSPETPATQDAPGAGEPGAAEKGPHEEGSAASDPAERVDTGVKDQGGESVDASPPSLTAGVPRASLAAVRDNTYFRVQESAAFFGLLGLLRRNEQAEIDRASLGCVSYAQLFRQSEAYRGRLVTIAGVVRRVERLEAPANDEGIAHYDRLAITPDDNPTMILFAYCLELPKGFPQGNALSEHVTATGYYFKRWAYLASDAVRTTPTLLLKTVAWQPPAALKPDPPLTTMQIALVVGGTALASAVAVGLIYVRSRRRPQPRPPLSVVGDKP